MTLDEVLPFLIPLIVLQLILIGAALYDLTRPERRVRGGSKLVWGLVCCTLSRSAVAAAAIGIGGMILLAIVAAIPTIAPYLPAGISGAPAQAVALGTDPGPLVGPVLANLALIVGLATLSWLVFRRQEL